MDVFWNLDFGRISEGFWEGFGRPKSLIFALFSIFFRCKISNATWKGKKSKKMRKNNLDLTFEADFAVRAGLGGRIIGWGEGKFGQSFKPGLKIDF